MKWKSWAVIGLSSLGTACGPDIELGDRPLFANGVNTVTYVSYDAITGAPIENATLKVDVGAHVLDAKTNGNSHVVGQLPYGTFPTAVSAPGYLSFAGQTQTDCNGNLTSPTSQCFKTYQVALFPEGAVNEDVQVKVFDSTEGAPVTSGRVIATLTNAPTHVGTNFSNLLPGSFNTRPSTVVMSLGADGSAVLPKGSLVLGGTYSVDVFGGRNAKGAFLRPTENKMITVGVDLPQMVLFMGTPAVDPIALSANNEKPAVLDALVIKFPYPVEVCSDESSHGWYMVDYQGDLNGNGVMATPDASRPVTVTTTDGALTVRANFAIVAGVSTFQPTDGRLVVMFSGISVKVQGASNCVPLTSVGLRSSSSLSTRLQMAETL